MILEYIMGTGLLLIMASGAYCLFEQTRYEQKQWEKRKQAKKK